MTITRVRIQHFIGGVAMFLAALCGFVAIGIGLADEASAHVSGTPHRDSWHIDFPYLTHVDWTGNVPSVARGCHIDNYAESRTSRSSRSSGSGTVPDNENRSRVGCATNADSQVGQHQRP
jgi:hypothetical protein